MFTGLVETMGTVQSLRDQGAGRDLTIAAPALAVRASLGESIALNGVCLTVIAHDQNTMCFQAGPETLRCTNLGALHAGDRVNLERALAVGALLGGHIVQGHVDGVGTITRRERQGEWEAVWIQCPGELAQQMVAKGSVTVDGVSLTLVMVAATSFSVALIPHTLEQTTLGFKKAKDSVNLETDLIGKYVWNYLSRQRP